MGEAVEEGGRHLRIAEHAWPFTEGEVCRDEDQGALIEPADQMEEELTAGLGEGQIAEFVDDDEVEAGEIVGDASLAAGAAVDRARLRMGGRREREERWRKLRFSWWGSSAAFGTDPSEADSARSARRPSRCLMPTPT